MAFFRTSSCSGSGERERGQEITGSFIELLEPSSWAMWRWQNLREIIIYYASASCPRLKRVISWSILAPTALRILRRNRLRSFHRVSAEIEMVGIFCHHGRTGTLFLIGSNLNFQQISSFNRLKVCLKRLSVRQEMSKFVLTFHVLISYKKVLTKVFSTN